MSFAPPLALPLALPDLAALLLFLACWAGYTIVADHVGAVRRHSVIAAMDGWRHRWAAEMARRENRITDTQIAGNLQRSVAFLASTAIFVVGGLVAMLGASEQGLRVVQSLPLLDPADSVGWEPKLILLIAVFTYAFFKCTWSMRQFNYLSTVIGAMPPPEADAAILRAGADIAARVANRGAQHFNVGLRAFYFGLAALAWLGGPVPFMAASVLVVLVLYRREFRSATLAALGEDAAKTAPDRAERS